MPTSRSAVAAVALAATFASAPAHATVVRALDLSEKARIAQLIVVGRVERQAPRWMNGERGAIKTIITVRVEETIKGTAKAGQRIQVVIPGGQIGELVHSVPGTSAYTDGERAVLFLEPHPDGWVELGVGIGKYEVQLKDGQPMVSHNPTVAMLRAAEPGKPAQIGPAPQLAPVTLPKFLAQVRAALKVTP